VSNDLFKAELEFRASILLDTEKVKIIKEATDTYFGVNNTVSGREFFEKIILEAPKDYPTNDMRFYQAVTELKVRLGRIFDDSVAYEKLLIEKEMLDLDIEELVATATTRRDELFIQLKNQELVQKKIRIAFAKDALDSTAKEIEDFKAIADKYAAKGPIKTYQDARVEEMEKKIEARYLNHVLTGLPFSPSEIAFYYTDTGALKPPAGVPDKLKLLGRPDLAQMEQGKIDAINRAEVLALESKKTTDSVDGQTISNPTRKALDMTDFQEINSPQELHTARSSVVDPEETNG